MCPGSTELNLEPGAAAGTLALESIGTHFIVEMYDCPRDLLNDKSFVTSALRGAVDQGLATLLHEVSHQFHPQGVTALALIAESHVAIHTWPEHGYAAADVFTCGETADPKKACLHLIKAFRARRHAMTQLSRGVEAVAPEPALAAATDHIAV